MGTRKNGDSINGYRGCVVINGITVRKHALQRMRHLSSGFALELKEIIDIERKKGNSLARRFQSKQYALRPAKAEAQTCAGCNGTIEGGELFLVTYDKLPDSPWRKEYENINKYCWCTACSDDVAGSLLAKYGIELPEQYYDKEKYPKISSAVTRAVNRARNREKKVTDEKPA